jgi:sirohydrochlorin ferrochelatase
VTDAVTGLYRDGARQVVVATYLLAPGFFADRIRRDALAAGARAVSAALGAIPEVAEVILDRYRAAQSENRAAA